MVVGENQALRGDEGRRAIRQAYGGQAHMIEPLLGYSGAVGALNRGRWEIIECPHAFIG